MFLAASFDKIITLFIIFSVMTEADVSIFLATSSVIPFGFRFARNTQQNDKKWRSSADFFFVGETKSKLYLSWSNEAMKNNAAPKCFPFPLLHGMCMRVCVSYK